MEVRTSAKGTEKFAMGLRTSTSGTMTTPPRSTTLGFRPTCKCYDARYRIDFPKAHNARKRLQHHTAGRWFPRVRMRPGLPTWTTTYGVVLDPFAGSGTTGQVAIEQGRGAILIELNPAYGALIERRVRTASATATEASRQVPLPFSTEPPIQPSLQW